MSLAAARARIVDALADYPDVKVYDHVPESLVAPAIVIQPDEPYLDDDGQPFNAMKIGWLVSIVTRVGTNERMTADLDTHIEAVVDRLQVSSVSAPYRFAFNNATYLAANAKVSGDYKIGE